MTTKATTQIEQLKGHFVFLREIPQNAWNYRIPTGIYFVAGFHAEMLVRLVPVNPDESLAGSPFFCMIELAEEHTLVSFKSEVLVEKITENSPVPVDHGHALGVVFILQTMIELGSKAPAAKPSVTLDEIGISGVSGNKPHTGIANFAPVTLYEGDELVILYTVTFDGEKLIFSEPDAEEDSESITHNELNAIQALALSDCALKIPCMPIPAPEQPPEVNQNCDMPYDITGHFVNVTGHFNGQYYVIRDEQNYAVAMPVDDSSLGKSVVFRSGMDLTFHECYQDVDWVAFLCRQAANTVDKTQIRRAKRIRKVEMEFGQLVNAI